MTSSIPAMRARSARVEDRHADPILAVVAVMVILRLGLEDEGAPAPEAHEPPFIRGTGFATLR
jgi:hypothetical protein